MIARIIIDRGRYPLSPKTSRSRPNRVKKAPGAVMAFEVPPFGWHVHLYTSREALRKVIGSDNDFESFAGLTTHHPSSSTTIYVGIFENAHGVIAHECIHAAIMGMQSSGIPVSAKNDEVLCYTVGWMVDRITDKLLDIADNSVVEKESEEKCQP